MSQHCLSCSPSTTLAVIVLVLLMGYSQAECPSKTVYNDSMGNFTAPSNQSMGDNCVIVIQREGTENNFTTLHVSGLDVTAGTVLELYDGEESPENWLLNITSSVNGLVLSVVAFSPKLTIAYSVGKPGSKWNIEYNAQECRAEVALQWAVRLTPPTYLPSRGSVCCSYNVKSQLPALRVPVASFSSLILVNGSFLNVSSGPAAPVQYTSSSPTKDFFPRLDQDGQLQLDFFLENATELQAFSLLLESVMSECSMDLTLAGDMKTIDLDIPGVQLPQFSCRLLIRSNHSSTTILTNVTRMDISDGNDLLSFYDGASSSTLPPVSVAEDRPGYLFLSSGQIIIMSLVLGNHQGPRSVSVEITEQAFGGRLTGEGQLLAGSAQINQGEVNAGGENVTIQAVFQLTASAGQLVNVEVATPLSANASLTFFKGSQTSSGVLTLLKAGENELTSVIGASDALVVLSDFQASDNFTAQFTSAQPGCDALATASSGQLSFSENLVVNTTESCTWTLAPLNSGEHIVLDMDALNLGLKDSVTVYSGLDQDKTVALFTGSNIVHGMPLPQIHLPSVPKTRIVIKPADPSRKETTVIARYKSVQEACGGQLTEANGNIQTPNFPNQYPLNAHCVWTFTSAEVQLDLDPAVTNSSGKSFLISFVSMALSENHSISLVDASNSSSQKDLAVFAGSKLPDDLIVPMTSLMKIQFDSPSEVNGTVTNLVDTGAQILYWILECGGNVSSSDNGTFTSPNYPKPPAQNALCVWIIQAPPSPEGEDSTYIVEFNITSRGKQVKSIDRYLKFFDGPSVHSPVLTTNASKGGLSTVLTRLNTVVVHFDYTRAAKDPDDVAFTLTYTTHYCNASQMCDNGICLHPAWLCNGNDDCGDNTDERNCVYPPPPKPAPQSYDGYVKSSWVPVCLFIGIALGAALLFVVPRIIRRLRAGRATSYNRMSDSSPVV